MGGNLSAEHFPILTFNLSTFPYLLGGVAILMISIIVILWFMDKEVDLEVKWTVIAIGLSNTLLLFSDICVPVFQISMHEAYLVHATLVVMLIYLFL